MCVEEYCYHIKTITTSVLLSLEFFVGVVVVIVRCNGWVWLWFGVVVWLLWLCLRRTGLRRTEFRRTPLSRTPSPDRPTFRSFFPSPATIFIPYSLSWGSSRGILVMFEAPGPTSVCVWALGLSCATPAALGRQEPTLRGPPLAAHAVFLAENE